MHRVGQGVWELHTYSLEWFAHTLAQPRQPEDPDERLAIRALLPFMAQPDNIGMYMVLGGLALFLGSRAWRGDRRALMFGGLVVAAATLSRTDGVLLSPNTPGWGAVRLVDAARAAFPGPPVAIMNDVKAAALAEATRGALAAT